MHVGLQMNVSILFKKADASLIYLLCVWIRLKLVLPYIYTQLIK